MPYHAGGRKPGPPPKKPSFPWYYRLLIGGIGAWMAWFGSYPRTPATFGHINRRGQEVYPNSMMMVGVVLLAASLIPVAWIDRATRRIFR